MSAASERSGRLRDVGGSRGVASFPVTLDRDASSPLPVQLAASLRLAIDAATLRPGEPVPATRELASRLGIARGVVVAAYQQLIAEGYLSAAQGRATRVNPDLVPSDAPTEWVSGAGCAAGVAAADASTGAGASEPPLASMPPAPLAPGVAITDGVLGSAWRAAWKDAAAAFDEVATAAPPLGVPALRSEIADHLRRMRGTRRTPRDVIVTAGTRDGLWLLLTSIGGNRGRELVVGVEDPGLPSLRGVASRAGARIVALPADDEGLDTSRLPRGMLDAVIVTPSHQYPLGGSLPLTRRRELLAWARTEGVVVVEDDYDSELRYTGQPLPTLAALDDPQRGVVVLLGTFSRTLTPALGAGYLIAPQPLRARMEPVRAELGSAVSGVVQHALARYLASGALRRHTARMLRRYAARRDLVSERLAGLPGARVRPMDGGLHAVLEFTDPPEISHAREAQVTAAARDEGLAVEALSRYWQRREANGIAGLVLGFGGSDDAAFDVALRRLRARILAESSARERHVTRAGSSRADARHVF
ncbi:MocR-like pyridoxine biosynthesis transcription factor PdxR [Leucobacter japonicus]|uniref:MocR-like pyridoxine biosynthesis transcription factor PdxR n=1 Tax=Leucobacter japonicus TaxID=1461259 RepID=UPI000949A45D|nr:PLP-dependent aminotransferase family protein [Leucobacter japonicus]